MLGASRRGEETHMQLRTCVCKTSKAWGSGRERRGCFSDSSRANMSSAGSPRERREGSLRECKKIFV